MSSGSCVLGIGILAPRVLGALQIVQLFHIFKFPVQLVSVQMESVGGSALIHAMLCCC